MTTALLFGSTGFIGSHVRAELAPNTHLVCPGRGDCDLAAADVPELTALLRRVRPDVVVLCAGRTTGSGHQLVHDNAVVTGKLLEAVPAAAPSARFIRIGSAAEYGPVPPHHRARETDPVAPVSEYGLSQLTATRLVELAGRVDGVVLRVFNPVGPGLAERYALGRAAALIRRALASGASHLDLEPMDAYRDFVDVRDVAAAVRAAAFAPLLPQRVFNIGSGQAVRTGDAVAVLAEVAGLARVVESPAPRRAAGALPLPWSCADPSRAETVLGWRAEHSLKDGVTSLWDAAVRSAALIAVP